MLTIKEKNAGFTLIELLVVIAIISLLSSIIFASLTSARVKARDAKRIADMHEIINALNLYFDLNGCLPRTATTACPGAGGYSESNAGGWDYSSQGSFLTFLETSGFMSHVNLDPINNMPGDSTPATYSYKYYCYMGPTWFGPHLGYWRESDYQYITVIPQGGNMTTNRTDASILCK